MQKIGRYEIRDKLGKGAMGAVVRAYDPQTGREVAIKVLRRRYSTDSKVRMRFLREVTTVAQLNHPAIVPIHDSGIDNGRAYLVMPLMTGGNLAHRIRDGLSMEEIQLVIDRIGSALDAVHRQQIVHRDVKPENILFDNNNRPYLADFGIVRRNHDEGEEQFTTVDTVIGTPAYMSPEQANGSRDIDSRSDFYSLGVVLFEMLTGQIPFVGDQERSTAVKHIVEPIPNIRQYNPQLPRRWQHINKKALAKQPDKRFQSGYAFATAVRAAIEKRAMPTPILYGVFILALLIIGGIALWPRSTATTILPASTSTARPPTAIAATATTAAERITPAPATMTPAQVTTAAPVVNFINCTNSTHYGFALDDPLFDPPRGTNLQADESLSPKVIYPITVTGDCPLVVSYLRSRKNGQDRFPILRDATGALVNQLNAGETGQIEIGFDSAAEVMQFDDEWELILNDPDGFALTFAPDQALPTLLLVIDPAHSESWLVPRSETPTAVVSPAATENRSSTLQPTATPQLAATQTRQAALRFAAATQTAQAINAANFNATQTAQAVNSANFNATQTAIADDFTATQTTQVNAANATQTAQAANAANWNATQTAQARIVQITRTAMAQATTAANFNATQTAQAVNANNVKATQTAQTQATSAAAWQATQTAEANRQTPTFTPTTRPSATPTAQSTATPTARPPATPTQTSTPLPSPTPFPTSSDPLEFSYHFSNCRYQQADWLCDLAITPHGGTGGPYKIEVMDDVPPSTYENVAGTQIHIARGRRCGAWVHEIRVTDQNTNLFHSQNIFFDVAQEPLFPNGQCTPYEG